LTKIQIAPMLFSFLWSLILSMTAGAPAASCEETLDAGEDITLCHPGGITQLNGTFTGDPGNILTVQWSPATGLSNPTILTPIANVNQTRTYTLTLKHYSADNIFENGDFEAGNTGFSSNYLYSPANLVPEGVYAITPNPNNQHPGFSPCGDHTSGSGNMMAVNGAGTPNQNIWCQTVSVTPNTDYVFIAWATSLIPVSPAILQFSANGNLLGSSFQISPSTCMWQQYYTIWNSGAATSATFCIVNQNTVQSGNDFALDDIFLSEVCEYTDEVTVFVRDPVEVTIDTVLCLGEELEIGGQYFSEPGEYEVLLYTPEGCDSTIFANIEQVYVEAIIAEPDVITCIQEEVTLDGSASQGSGGIDFWYWSTWDGIIRTDPYQPFVDVTAPGTYQLKVGTTVQGVTCYDSIEVVVLADTLGPLFTIEEPDRLSCRDSILTLRGIPINIPPGAGLQWSTPNGEILSGANTLEATVKGIGRYFLQITDTLNGCSSEASVEVLGDTSLPQMRILDIPTLNCLDTVGLLQAEVLKPANGYSIQWQTLNGTIEEGENGATPKISQPGQYQMIVTDSATGCRTTLSVEVQEDLRIPALELPDRDTLGCQMDSLLLDPTVLPDTIVFQYLWQTQDGQFLSDTDQADIWIGRPGSYVVLVTHPVSGCSVADTAEIIRFEDLPPVNAGPDIVIDCRQTTVTPDVSGSDDRPGRVFTWYLNNQVISQVRQPTFSAAGEYIMEIFNPENGCLNRDTLQVTDIRSTPSIDLLPPEVLTCLRSEVQVQSQIAQVTNPVFSWTGPVDGILSGAQSATPVLQRPGWYYVTLTDDRNGCLTTDSIRILEDRAFPVIRFANPDTLDCVRKEVSLDGRLSGPAARIVYSWSKNGPGIVSGAQGPQPVVNAEGYYRLTLRDTINGCETIDSIRVYRNLDLPPLSIDPAGPLTCDRRSLRLQGMLGSGWSGLELRWNTPDGRIVQDGQTVTPLIDRAGTYYFVVSNPSNGCIDSVSVVISADTLPPVADAGPDRWLPCDPMEVLLRAGDQANATYQWQHAGGGIQGPSNQQEIRAVKTGLYFLEVRSSRNGCTARDTTEVKQENPGTMTLALRPPTCRDTLAGLSLIGGQGGTAPYLFIVNGVEYPSGSEVLVPSGNQLLQMKDGQGCLTDSILVIPDRLPLTVQHVDFIRMLKGDLETVQLVSNRPVADIVSVLWEPTDGVIPGQNLLEWILAPRVTTDYRIRVITFDGCENTSALRVVVDNPPAIFVPNVFTPKDRNGINDRFFPFSRPGTVKVIRSMEVFNRWGDRVFEQYQFPPDESQYGWDGRHRDMWLDPAVFLWVIEAEMTDGERIWLSGEVTLL
jgi:hypothetical protein